MKEQPIVAVSKKHLRSFPTVAGVYLMKDAAGKVIYVGKAKNLRARLRSYFHGTDGRYNVRFLMGKVYDVETLVTEDERQALVLESDLIKKYKPRYNIRLKDDKAHYLVRIDLNHEWPRLQLTRRIEEEESKRGSKSGTGEGVRYFGPFAFGYELFTMLDVIKRAIPLRTCSDKVIYNRVRPCLEYQIKRCAAPCCLPVDRELYLSWVNQAISILEGKNKQVIKNLTSEMERASKELRFEDAAMLRDRAEVLSKISADKPNVELIPGARDAFGLFRDGSDAEVSILTVRQGRLFGSKSFGFSDVEIPDEELLAAVMSQFYQGEEQFPDEILLPLPLEDASVYEALYRDKAGRAVKVVFPKKGSKGRLVQLAQSNAEKNFTGRFQRLQVEQETNRALQAELDLEEIPRTIECVDISHFQGQSTVASVVAFQDGRPEKSRYRRFHLTQEGKPDDFASMYEVVYRHLSRGQEEGTVCDLMVIDGGIGQLSQALRVRKELSLQRPLLISLAKKRSSKTSYKVGHVYQEMMKKPERVYVEGRAVPVVLEQSSEALRLLERIRDEAHRFALAFHRTSRTKRVFRSELELIPGIGVTRRKDLLREFGSVRAIREATAEELQSACGIPLKLAQKIVNTLRAAVKDRH